MAALPKGARVLDVFCHVGAFGLGCAKAGAKEVVLVDRSAPALEQALAAALPGDALARVEDPQVWLKVQILRQAVHAARDAAMAEIGPALDVGVGFNAADGD